jgi:hypothetical protein
MLLTQFLPIGTGAGRLIDGERPAPVPIGGRSSRPPAEREALNLVLDVLAQLLEDAFDVLGRTVIGERP